RESYPENHFGRLVFIQPGSKSTDPGLHCDVWYSPGSDQNSGHCRPTIVFEGRAFSALPRQSKRRPARLLRGHRLLRCQGTAPCSQSSYGRAAAGRHANFLCAGRSTLPWFVATPELAVDRDIEQRQVARLLLDLELGPDCPDVF